MLEILTGAGLASAAGLNAYVPLLLVGLITRYTALIPLGESWQWLENPVALIAIGILLVVELIADKIPTVDTINDALQTVVRPASGGITFGAGASATTVSGTGDSSSWGPILAGIVIALAWHAVKSLSRPVINTVTVGAGGPVVSAAEDTASVGISLLAILVPALILVAIPALIGCVVWARRRRKRRTAEKDEARLV